jgi:uncharacterized protein (DUF983 family)
MAPCCRSCGLDFASFNVGDGPAALLILVIGALVTGLALWLELAAAPPFWLHLILWPPITALSVIASLRVTKALLLALEWTGRHAPDMAEAHGHEAHEGRHMEDSR